MLTEEEYNELVQKCNNYRKDILKYRHEIQINKLDEYTLFLIKEKLKKLEQDWKRTKLLIQEYKLTNNIDKKERGIKL